MAGPSVPWLQAQAAAPGPALPHRQSARWGLGGHLSGAVCRRPNGLHRSLPPRADPNGQAQQWAGADHQRHPLGPSAAAAALRSRPAAGSTCSIKQPKGLAQQAMQAPAPPSFDLNWMRFLAMKLTKGNTYPPITPDGDITEHTVQQAWAITIACRPRARPHRWRGLLPRAFLCHQMQVLLLLQHPARRQSQDGALC